MLRPDRAAGLTLGELFKDWIANHAAPNTGERYATDSVRTWDAHIEPRLGRVKLGTLASDPSIIVRFHEGALERKATSGPGVSRGAAPTPGSCCRSMHWTRATSTSATVVQTDL